MSPEQKLEQVLIERGFLTQAQIIEVRERSLQSGIHFEDVIIATNILSISELQQAKNLLSMLEREAVHASPSVASLPLLPQASALPEQDEEYLASTMDSTNGLEEVRASSQNLGLEEAILNASFAETLAPESLSKAVQEHIQSSSDSHGELNVNPAVQDSSCSSCGFEFEELPKLCPNCQAFLQKPAHNDKFVGRTLGGRFRLNGRLGAGGMGLVYHATDQTDQTFVACKILPLQLSTDESTVQRFQLEAKVMLELQHPHIVRAIDYGFEEDIGCYLAMELLIGQELKDFLKSKKILSADEISRVFSLIAEAMAYAHEQGIIHRDLKPSNIFLLDNPEHPLAQPKVIDFGIARLTTDDMPRHTVTGTFLGTPQYMSPEQAAAKKDLDHRSDIYSLGIILYQTLSGRLPFVGDHLAQVLLHQIYMQPPKLAEVRPEITYPSTVQSLIDRILDKEPAQRPESMIVFLQELLVAMNSIVTKDYPETTDFSDEKVIAEKLTAAANTILAQYILPPLEGELEPSLLFEQLALALRTPRKQSQPSPSEQTEVLMLSEEVFDDEALLSPDESYVVPAPPSAVLGRIQPVSRMASELSSSSSLPTSSSSAIGLRTARLSSAQKAFDRGARGERNLSSVETELYKAQQKKFVFMLIFAFVFFTVLMFLLWFVK